MNESATAWPLSLRLAHWLSAILVLAALGLGAYMVLLVANPAQRFDLTQTHKALGITILALTVVRLACRAFMRAPKPEQAAPSIGWAAKASHIALYGLLLLMPLSGWLILRIYAWPSYSPSSLRCTWGPQWSTQLSGVIGRSRACGDGRCGMDVTDGSDCRCQNLIPRRRCSASSKMDICILRWRRNEWRSASRKHAQLTHLVRS